MFSAHKTQGVEHKGELPYVLGIFKGVLHWRGSAHAYKTQVVEHKGAFPYVLGIFKGVALERVCSWQGGLI